MITSFITFIFFMKITKIIIPLLLATSIFLAGCSGEDKVADSGNTKGAQAANTQMSMKAEKPPELSSQQLGELQAGINKHSPTSLTFNVGGGNFYFVPNVIRVKQGDTVKIIFTNNGGFHNFVLDEFGIKFDPIKTGETKTVQFLAKKKGRFEYYCSVANHIQKGQKGQLVVE